MIDEDLSIGTVAARAGVNVSALRFYEERGLITSRRSEGGQRRYSRSVLRRLAFIQVAQRVGLTLEEIGHALATLPGDDGLTAADWRRLSTAWRPMLEARIRLLEGLRDDLDSCIGCGCLSLERCRLRNPGDAAAGLGTGPRYLLGDRPWPDSAHRPPARCQEAHSPTPDDDAMTSHPDLGDPSRRSFVLAALGAAVAAVLAACGRNGSGNGAAAPAAQKAPTTAAPPPATGAPGTTAATTATTAAPATLAPTPECKDGDDVTPAQTEGPYFKASSPERTNVRAGASGTNLVLTGTVLTTDCKPVARALVDFWQADAGGNYDNSGYGFRGHQFTDAQGRYRLETVLPGFYPGRTRHIHVKVQAPGGRVLTTQLYFPGEARNASDGIYRKELLVDVRDVADGKAGTFAFVVS